MKVEGLTSNKCDHASSRDGEGHVVETLVVESRRERERHVLELDRQSVLILLLRLGSKRRDTVHQTMVDARRSLDLDSDPRLRLERIREGGDVRSGGRGRTAVSAVTLTRFAIVLEETHRMLTIAKDALNIEKNEVINFPVSSPWKATCRPPYQTADKGFGSVTVTSCRKRAGEEGLTCQTVAEEDGAVRSCVGESL